MIKQQSFYQVHWKHRFSYGGTLRRSRKGRGMRPLSSREPLHLVLKANSSLIRGGFRTSKRFFLIHFLLRKYALKFHIKIEQVSIQSDHIHLLIRAGRRSRYQSFFRVLSGQIAQQMEKKKLLTLKVTDTPKSTKKEALGDREGLRKGARGEMLNQEVRQEGLWLYRPFTRVVRGWRAYKIVRDYIQLNEKEALGEIPYRSTRLKGLLMSEWEGLWR